MTYKLRDGLLVGLNTTMSGNVTYRKEDIGVTLHRSGAESSEWKTERTIEDKAEHERAKVIRSQAVYAVRKVCATTAFGYLCPLAREAELTKAIAEAQAMVAKFNASAKTTRLGFHVITGRIDASNAEAAKAISAEVASLCYTMGEQCAKGDVKALRDAADKAAQVSAMLIDVDATDLISTVDKVREIARDMAKGKDPSAAMVALVAASTVDFGASVIVPLTDVPAVAAEPAAPVAVPTMSDSERALAALKARKADAKRAQMR